jgi:Skp family chaperone for outer membrane proteins
MSSMLLMPQRGHTLPLALSSSRALLARIIKEVKKILDEIDKRLKYIKRHLEHYSRIFKALQEKIKMLLKEIRDEEVKLKTKRLEEQLDSIVQRLSE